MTADRRGRTCAACGQESADGARYCSGCGRPLSPETGHLCTGCGAPNPEGAGYCLACGAALGPPAQAERRVITVLFADLSGFTALTETLDPEDVQELIAGCLDHLCEGVERWGGFVDKFIGDCVMALFGAPVAYENEAERAVRAALDMHAALERWSPPELEGGGFRPRVRIGINTGPVVTGVFSGGGARDYTVVGDTVNVAARLQGVCEPGRILADATTYEQTRHVFEYEDEQVFELRGRREPVSARYVLGVREERARSRGFLDRRPELVGREPQLSALRDRWARARGAAEPQISLVVGPAGIGKSRLVEAFVQAEGLGESYVAIGRSYPYASSTPWEPIAELIRSLHGLDPDLAVSDAAARIVELDAEAWSPEEVAALAVTLGRPISRVEALGTLSPEDRRELVTRSIVRAIEAGVPEPRLLVLEDLHWADQSTLDFLRRLPGLGLERPLLMLLVARPALPDEASLSALLEAVETRIEVPPLSPAEAERFVDVLLQRHALPDEVRARILTRAEGNPLFIEAILRSMAESGVLRQEEGVWSVEQDRDLEIPDSVESVLSTRIDGLDPSAKRVLQYAAVVGRRFWRGVLAQELEERAVDSKLEDLLDADFVRALPASVIEGDREFMFQHLLLQEVAYQGTLRGLRAELHGAVARWLESRGADAAPEFEEWVAYHYERSREPERAVKFLERAARRAREGGALLDARSLVDRALEIAGDPRARLGLLKLSEEIAAASGESERRSADLYEMEALANELADAGALGEVGYLRARHFLDAGRLTDARGAAQTALETLAARDEVTRQDDLLSLLGRVAHLSGDFEEAMRRYREALELHRRTGDRSGEAETLDRLGLAEVDFDNFMKALDRFDAALALVRELGDRPAEARTLAHRATALHWLGQYEEAERVARQALEIAEASGSRDAVVTAELALGSALGALGEAEEARRALTRVCDAARETGRAGLEARGWLALAAVDSGDDALRALELARDLAERRGLVHVEILAFARLAELALAGDDLSAADHSSAEAIQRLRLTGHVEGPEESVLYVRARTLSALGDDTGARELLREAREIVGRKADRITNPDWRNRYLEIPLNREIMECEL